MMTVCSNLEKNLKRSNQSITVLLTKPVHPFTHYKTFTFCLFFFKNLWHSDLLLFHRPSSSILVHQNPLSSSLFILHYHHSSTASSSCLYPYPSLLYSYLFPFPHETILFKAMNPLSSLLLILLVSHLFHHSALAMTKLEEFGIDRGRESSMDLDVQERPFEGDHKQQHFHRKELHEVHSGPNPISNSVPQQRS